MEILDNLPRQIEQFRLNIARFIPGVSSTEVKINPRGVNELSPEVYLDTLTPIDRIRVEDFVNWSYSLSRSFGDQIRLGVLAVGSTVRPVEKRHHDPLDIDLRIINSALTNTDDRKDLVSDIQTSVREYVNQLGFPYEEKPLTLETRLVPITSGNKTELGPFLDWYNDDPSFEVRPPEGLPLHLSISGVDNYELIRYLEINRRSKGYFSVLMSDAK